MKMATLKEFQKMQRLLINKTTLVLTFFVVFPWGLSDIGKSLIGFKGFEYICSSS